MAIALTKYGGKIEIVVDTDTDNIIADPSDVDMVYNTSSNTISFRIKDSVKFQQYTAVPIASVTMGGVVITSYAVYKTQLALVFPEANSGDGGSGTVDSSLSRTSTNAPQNAIVTQKLNDSIIDLAKAYGVVADGSTDNATALMQMRTDYAGTGKPVYHIYAPSGEIRSSNPRFLYGIERFILEGAGTNNTVFRTLYSGSDWQFQRPFNSGHLFEDNVLTYSGTTTITSNYLFNTVAAGSLTITTTTAADAGNFSAGTRVLLWGRDQVGNGYPPGVRYFEWAEVVTAVAGTGVITLKYPLKYSYASTWHDVPDLLASGKNVGKARITPLDRANGKYCRYAEFRNLTFGNSTGGGNGYGMFAAEKLVVTNCHFESFVFPSENKIAIYTDCTIAGELELDKIVDDCTFIRCKITGKISNGGGINNLKFIDCHFSQSVAPCSKNIEIRNCFFRGDSSPDTGTAALSFPPAKLTTRRVVLENLKFASTASYANTAYIDLAVTHSYTIAVVSGNNIIIPKVAFSEAEATFTPIRTIDEGVTSIFKSDGTKGGLVTSITYDPTYNSNQGAWTIAGNWNVAPVVAEVWKWSNIGEIIDLGGHTVTDRTKRMYSGDSLKWAGNTTSKGQIHSMIVDHKSIKWVNGGSSELVTNFYAKIIDIDGFVIKAYNGSSTPVRWALCDSSYSEIYSISLLTAARRIANEYIKYPTSNITGDLITIAKIGVWQTVLNALALDTSGNIDDQDEQDLPEMNVVVRWTEF